MNNIGVIYSIHCSKTNKYYIGQTRDKLGLIKKSLGIKRFRHHLNLALREKNDCPKLYRAIRKYGSKSFTYSPLIYCELDDLNYFEIKFIKLYDCINYGYNVCDGGSISYSGDVKKRIYQKVSEGNKRSWKNKAIREKRLIGMKKSSGKVSAATKKHWQDPSYRKIQTKHNKERWTLKRREHMSSKKKKHKLPSCMTKYTSPYSKKHTGYRTGITIRGKRYRKCFTSNKNSLDENFSLANEWLNQIKKQHEIT